MNFSTSSYMYVYCDHNISTFYVLSSLFSLRKSYAPVLHFYVVISQVKISFDVYVTPSILYSSNERVLLMQ